MKLQTAGTCVECGSPCHRDKRYEIVCSDCGLVQDKLKDESWKACEKIVFESESESEDWFVDAAYGLIDEPKQFWNREQYEPMPYHVRENGAKETFWPFTHDLFLQTAFKRCLIEIQHLPDKCPLPDAKSCIKCKHAISTSLRDRERGYINELGDLPNGLSWPMACLYTLQNLPIIMNPSHSDNDSTVYAEYTDEELAEFFKKLNAKYHLTLPTTAKTVKKYRNKDVRLPWFPPHADQKYEDTPIGDLLEASPLAGRAALAKLSRYHLMWRLEGDRYCMWPREPTRETLIRFFMGKSTKGDLAEKQFSLLTSHKIMKILRKSTKHEGLCYVTRKKLPEIPRVDPGVFGWNDCRFLKSRCPRKLLEFYRPRIENALGIEGSYLFRECYELRKT